ncbi:formylglycine-generating enzyme family protein [uncultured Thiodictyon sp.]|uniref:formylglycine-generating enzyme family protein n=1 Tax=uncultured Thiodictyon sp. TaxID=1846217 RepID=UPI0025FDBB92|nr:formylglycine-generating enzyme family protein [uncultured Thiodictyon sp.]
MEPTVRDTLRQLIVQHGRALSDDPPRCETMLRDLCGHHQPEIALLISALQQRVPAALLANAAGLPPPLLVDQLRQRLTKELFLTAEAAQWAVETWALALGIVAQPAPEPAAAPEPPPKPAKKSKPPPPPPAPLPTFRDRLKDGSEGPEMVRLPAGRFLMGGDDTAYASERPQHEVHIAQPFAIGRFPVTFEEYDRFVLANQRPPAAKHGWRSRIFGREEDKQHELPNDEGWGRGRRPVMNVSWNEAVAYCSWLTEQTGRIYRLPSEAEWEYACRAGTETRWSCGDDEKALSDHAWFAENSGGKAHPVGEKRPNPWGLHDLHGNVLEWVQDQDQRDPGYQGAPADGSAWEEIDAAGALRVVRGGSWFSPTRAWCCYSRIPYKPGTRHAALGFRCARVR